MLSEKNKTMGAMLVCLAATLWGFDSIVLTPRLFKLSVPYVVFMVHLLPFIGMTLIFGKDELKNVKKLDKRDLMFFFLVALFGGSLGTLSIVKALFLVNFHHLTVVTLLQKLQPVFAIILARIILKEREGKGFLFWAVMALIGGYLLTFQFNMPQMVYNGNMLLACFYALLAAFSFGSATVFGKRILKNASFRTALYLRYGLTTFIMFFIASFTGSFSYISHTTPVQWLIFGIIGLTSGSGAILLYYKGLRYIKANVATMCELCFPVSSILFDYIFNGNVLSTIQILSAVLMLYSIYKITKNRANE